MGGGWGGGGGGATQPLTGGLPHCRSPGELGTAGRVARGPSCFWTGGYGSSFGLEGLGFSLQEGLGFSL